MTPCTYSASVQTTCHGTDSNFTQFIQSGSLSKGGAKAKVSLSTQADQYGYSFSGSVTGAVWSGTWTKVSTGISGATGSGTFSVILNIKPAASNNQIFNVEDLVVQLYSQNRQWELAGQTSDTMKSVTGSYQVKTIPNDGGWASIGGLLVKQSYLIFKYSDSQLTQSNAINYSAAGQIPMSYNEPGGMEITTNAGNYTYPKTAKLGDQGVMGASQTYPNYPLGMDVGSNTTYGWVLKQEINFNILCLTSTETMVKTSLKNDESRCHEVTIDGKIGPGMYIKRMQTLANGTAGTGFFISTK